MSPKRGVVHDYDLDANRESSASGNQCAVCGDEPVSYQWTDYSGEALCRNCGAPYQLKWGSDKQKEEGDYPYLMLKDGWAEAFREYWEETEKFTPLGTFLSAPREYVKSVEAFYNWVRENHPALLGEED